MSVSLFRRRKPKAALTAAEVSEKFTDDGLYAFRDPFSGAYRVMWAADLGSSIALSDDQFADVEVAVTAEQFDAVCWGIYHHVSPDGFPIERRRP